MVRRSYPCPPLRYVTFEVQFGYVPVLATEQGRAEAYLRLQDAYPVADAQMTTVIEFAMSPGVGMAPQQQQQAPELVLTDRERTRSVTVGATAVTVQTTLFTSSADLEAAVEAALRAVVEAGVSTTHRVGLRFIDEIRAPDVTQATDWLPYLSEDLVGPLRFAGAYEVEQSQALLGMRVSDDVHAIMRYGPGTGYAVDPNGRLRLPLAQHEKFFLLDIDTFWAADPARDLRAFTVEDVLGLYRQLDEPAHVLFERAITDRARDLFYAGTSTS